MQVALKCSTTFYLQVYKNVYNKVYIIIKNLNTIFVIVTLVILSFLKGKSCNKHDVSTRCSTLFHSAVQIAVFSFRF